MGCIDTMLPHIGLVKAGRRSRVPAADQERGATADSRVTGSGCSIQSDLQDGRIRP
jgi:hypothetical protein